MNTALDYDWDDFVHSPSRKDGIPEHVEKYLRADTCKFIDEFGSKEGLSGKMRCTACSLFHTFYLKVSFKTVPRWESAVACLILAAKIENKVQTIKKMTQRAAEYLRPNLNKELGKLTKKQANTQYYHWMAQIHIRERQILERLHGEIRIALPMKLIKKLDLKSKIIDENNRECNKASKYLVYIFLDSFKQFRKMLSFFYYIFFILYPCTKNNINIHNKLDFDPSYPYTIPPPGLQHLPYSEL